MNSNKTLTTAEPENLLRDGAAEIGLALSPATLQQFLKYAEELLKWNARINLTGLKTVPDVVVKHFLDSLAVWPWVRDLSSLADIGTGGGFPGLPLKLALPHLRLTLVEPTGKKTAFLHYVTACLGLTEVDIRQVHLTAQMAGQWGPRFQGVITRATFPLQDFLEMAAPLVQPGGRVLALKGPGLEDGEWQEAAAKHLDPLEKVEYSLPLTQERRLLVIWEKAA
jgi:16S rRNA (guanine527-N7)-methyltransferase